MPARVHQAFVDRDANQPCIETRISSEVRQVLECPHECVLRYFFRIRAVTSNGLSDAKYSTRVAVDELL